MSTVVIINKNKKPVTSTIEIAINRSNTIISSNKLIEFPQKNDSKVPENKRNVEIFRDPKLYHLLEHEFNPNNVAGSPPNTFISILQQRMDCYY